MPIEQHAPGLEHIVELHQEIEELARSFGGERGPAEGPVWWPEGGYLVFSDIGNNRRMKWSPGSWVTLMQEPTNEANGLTRDRQGCLVACEHLSRRVTCQDPDGSITVVANNYHGHRLNRPNDVAVKSDGSIYFTDPGLGRIESEPGEMLTGRRCILRPGLPWVVSARGFPGFLSHVGMYDRLR